MSDGGVIIQPSGKRLVLPDGRQAIQYTGGPQRCCSEYPPPPWNCVDCDFPLPGAYRVSLAGQVAFTETINPDQIVCGGVWCDTGGRAEWTGANGSYILTPADDYPCRYISGIVLTADVWNYGCADGAPGCGERHNSNYPQRFYYILALLGQYLCDWIPGAKVRYEVRIVHEIYYPAGNASGAVVTTGWKDGVGQPVIRNQCADDCHSGSVFQHNNPGTTGCRYEGPLSCMIPSANRTMLVAVEPV